MGLPRKKSSISKSQIKLAYKLFLNREPENQRVVRSKQKLTTIHALREEFINSHEFQNLIWPQLTPTFKSLKPHDLDNPSQVLMENVIRDWKKLGEENPYWSVLSSDKFIGQLDEKITNEFFASGQREIQIMIEAFAYHKIKIIGQLKILELGCGLGRVTKPLAEMADYVLGLDVSESYLKIAEKVLAGLGNVELELLNTPNFNKKSKKPFNLFFSIITLQHNPPAVQAKLLNNLLNALEKTQSYAYFQTCTYIENYDEHKKLEQKLSFETHPLPFEKIFEILKDNNFRVIDLWRDDYQMGPECHSYTFLVGN